MILTAEALLRATPHPTRAQIRDALEHNFCRCGAHQRILEAVEAAANAGAPV
jgi:nicotinate dehydrogenase subunit A